MTPDEVAEVRRALVELLAGARCASVPIETMTPTRDDTVADVAARSICAHCWARPDCLEFALELADGDERGIWAGLNGLERRQLIQRTHGRASALDTRLCSYCARRIGPTRPALATECGKPCQRAVEARFSALVAAEDLLDQLGALPLVMP